MYLKTRDPKTVKRSSAINICPNYEIIFFFCEINHFSISHACYLLISNSTIRKDYPMWAFVLGTYAAGAIGAMGAMGAIGAIAATGAVVAVSAFSTGMSPLVAFWGQSIHVNMRSSKGGSSVVPREICPASPHW